MVEIVNLAIYEKDKTVPNAFTALEAALKLKYSLFKELEGYVIVLNYNDRNFKEFKAKHPGKKIIVYQLEQISAKDNLWWNDGHKNPTVIERTARLKEWLYGCDVILEYDLENMDFLQSKGLGGKTIFQPLEFSEANVYHLPEEEKVYDILFFGSINHKRLEFLIALKDKFKMLIVGVYQSEHREAVIKSGLNIIPAAHGKNLWTYINKSKIILNLHYYNGIQEQVRMVDLLSNGKFILSEKSNWNYFGDLVEEFQTKEEMISQINDILVSGKWQRNDIASRFKDGDYKQYKVGAVYNSFYDLDLLETSLKSIRNVADYVVVIHQPISFKGEPCDAKYQDILSDLVKKGLIDDVVYYTRQHSVIDKRNIGLEMCRAQRCNYIIPLDNDECYNAKQLAAEISDMFHKNIHTLYCKIQSYYRDCYHYFTDTYFVPAVYKIDERTFEKLPSSVLCDPDRKMKEKTFKISDIAMHHLTYLPAKMNNEGISNPRNEYQHVNMNKLRKHFAEWKEGDKALVFANNPQNNNLIHVKEVELKTIKKKLF